MWGTGKTSLVQSFSDAKHLPFKFIDFDFGGGITPPLDRAKHSEWRYKQTKFWLDFARNEINNNAPISVICGVSLYPSQLIALDASKFLDPTEIGFGYLFASDEEREKRLHERGDGDIFEANKAWYQEFYNELEAHDAMKFDTTDKSKTEVADLVLEWLKSQTNKLNKS